MCNSPSVSLIDVLSRKEKARFSRNRPFFAPRGTRTLGVLVRKLKVLRSTVSNLLQQPLLHFLLFLFKLLFLFLQRMSFAGVLIGVKRFCNVRLVESLIFHLNIRDLRLRYAS